MAGLTDEQWRVWADADHAAAGAGFCVNLVGGAVRDHLMGITPADLDFATDATPEQVTRFMTQRGFAVHPTGISHGTVTVVIRDTPIEVTTLRVDKETDGRHAEVEFTTDWRADAARRDLTINSMFMTITGEVIDYFGGKQDIEKKILRFVGDAETRVQEDYLRILRFFRFYSRYTDARIDDATLNVLRQQSVGLRNISGERIWSEVIKIFEGPNRIEAAKLMHDAYVWDNISAALKYDAAAAKNMFWLDFVGGIEPVSFIACMLESVQDLHVLRERLRFETSSFKILKAIIEDGGSMTRSSVRRNLAHGIDPWLMRTVAMHYCNVPAIIIIAQFVKQSPKFPVSGEDVKSFGFSGKEVGDQLDRLKDIWADSEFKLNRDELMEMIDVK